VYWPVLDRYSSRPYTGDVDELFAAILGAIAEFLLEAFLELIAAAVLDLAFRALLGLFTSLAEAAKESRVFTGFVYTLLGVLAGALSLVVLPHPLIHREHPIRFHGISLLISPIITGLVLSSVGAFVRRWGKKVTPVETFGYGFALALGMALIRFFLAR
jgi:chromate transport protein ChrA